MDLQIIQALIFLVNSEVPTTERYIQGHVSGGNIYKRLRRLRDKGLVSYDKGEYWVTPQGHDLLQEARENPNLVWGKEYYDWRDEVETGIDQDGNESAMVNKVLPKSAHSYYSGDYDDAMVSRIQETELIDHLKVRNPGITIDKMFDYLAEGLVKHCKRCNELGIFRKDKSKKSGMRSICKYCERVGKNG